MEGGETVSGKDSEEAAASVWLAYDTAVGFQKKIVDRAVARKTCLGSKL